MYFNFWQNSTVFDSVLKSIWAIPVEVSTLFQVVSKLKNLKMALREWRKESFDTPSAMIQNLRQKLKEITEKLDSDRMKIQLQKQNLACNLNWVSGWQMRKIR